jgi:SAM-dependent methyltransferase
MIDPLGVYGSALRRAAAGDQPSLEVVGVDGVSLGRLHPAQWTGGLRPGDHGLLGRCGGSTLDVGCGPGRLAAALARTGRPALGVDISAEAIRQARRRGAAALRRSVFDPLPQEGAWRQILLADGNIGIGGDPGRLLRRCAGLLRPGGSVLAEVRPPGEPSWAADVVLRDGERRSDAFAWAGVAAPDVAGLAREAALRVLDQWTEAGRWFARIAAN